MTRNRHTTRRSGFPKALATVLIVPALALLAGGCQHSPWRDVAITVPYTAPYNTDIQVRSAVRRKCDLERRVAHEIASEIRSQFAAVLRRPAADAGTPGLALDLRIINVEGGVGAARGHKTLTVAGTLYRDGQRIGSFTATRRTKHGRHTCRMLWENIEEIAEDVARWLETPTHEAYLGDALPGDFYRPAPSGNTAPPPARRDAT